MNRHTQHSASCLRMNRTTRQMECRFRFPKELQEQTTIEVNPNNQKLVLKLKRNDPKLNNIIPSISVINRSNTDFQPIVSLDCCVNYIAKYAGKDEPQSNELSLIRSVSNRSYDSTTSLVQSILIKHCALRDYSAQECIYIIMGYPFYKSSRIFVVINLDDNAFIPYEVGMDNNRANSQSHASLYGNRLNNFEPPNRRGRRSNNPARIQDEEEQRQQIRDSIVNMSFYKFFSKFYFKSSQWHSYDKPPVMRIFPRLKYIPNQNNERYFKLKLKLYVPWQNNFEEFINPNNLTWFEVYQNYLESIENRINLDDIEIDEDSFDEDENDDEMHDIDLYDWMIYLRDRPDSQDIDQTELGLREQDANHNWSETYALYNIEREINFIANLREQNEDLNQVIEMPAVEFSLHQQRVLDVINAQIQYLRDGTITDNFRRSIVIQGKAGSGKSTLIQAIRFIINQAGHGCKIVAPTGAAASLINANTIHSTFKINTYRQLRNLHRQETNLLQEDFVGCKFIVIDEMSLVGCSLFRKIDLRCRTATSNNEPFGGMFIILLGDLKQLPPVLDRAFYGTNYNNEYVNEGQNLFNNIDSSIILPSSFRQAPEQQQFRNILDRLADAQTTVEDLSILNSRALPNLNDADEQARFQNSIRLFATSAEVNQFNIETLRSFPAVYRVEAIKNCRIASKTKSSDAGNLEKVLYLAIGSRVMLRRNLCTSAGLVNGALRTVVDIIVSPDQDDGPMPLFVMVHFDDPEINSNSPVPIAPVESSWISNNTECTRLQVPLLTAHSITIHKSQGMTLNTCVVSLGRSEKSLGLSYVALSRVRRLNDLGLDKTYEFERFSRIRNSILYNLRAELETRLNSISLVQ